LIDARVLNGVYRDSAIGSFESDPYRNFGFGATRGSLAGMPHFATNSFDGRFPVATLEFNDPAFPGAVSMTAFNPFIPTNERDSSLPAAMFEVSFTNPTDAPVTYTLAAVLSHGVPGHPMAHAVSSDSWQGIRIADDDLSHDEPDYAELLVATDAAETSRQTYFYRGLWYDALEVYWNDMARPGPFTDRIYRERNDAGGMIRDRDCSLQAGHLTLAPGTTGTVRMLIGWYAPVFQKYWISPVWHFKDASPDKGAWRNWYATEWPDVTAVASEIFSNWESLRADTFAFRDALYASTLPLPMLEAAAANLSTLKSPTVLRLEDGTLYGWEGCHPKAGSCEGSCTHVWNYQQAVAFLFPRLSRGMREADYAYNLGDDGSMSFRLGLPLGTRLQTEHACVDGQFGNVMLVYRDWRLLGDDAWLARLWPAIKHSIAYAWSDKNPDRWDPDRSGVLTGRQHHTLDMELFGPNAWLSGYYAGALQAAAEMAEALGEIDTAVDYRALAERGKTWIDANLFNGRYFIHRLNLDDKRLLKNYGAAERSRRLMGAGVEELYWSAEHNEIKYQIGEACFIDQLASQWHADLYGLPSIFDPEKCRSALGAIFRHNFVPALAAIANPGRVFGLGEESGTMVASWPEGARKPVVAIPYAQETLHGMEYTLGGAMLQYGLVEESISIFGAVRDRYDGVRRNPWSEIECGSNYARSLSSWGIMITAAGYQFDARRRHLGFSPIVCSNGRYCGFWSSAEAWGTVAITGGQMDLHVDYGTMALESIDLPLHGGAAATVTLNGDEYQSETSGRTVRMPGTALARGDHVIVTSPGLTLAAATEIIPAAPMPLHRS
jgi:uncharacterized protein (DUF608 family)